MTTTLPREDVKTVQNSDAAAHVLVMHAAPTAKHQETTPLPSSNEQRTHVLDQAFDAGDSSIWWARGRFVRHIAAEVRSTRSLCGKSVTAVSLTPMRTTLDINCAVCARTWNHARERFNARQAAVSEKMIVAIADELDTLLGIDSDAAGRCWAGLRNRALRTAVRDRLLERGLDLNFPNHSTDIRTNS
jgi:hypothetical protein